jgi:Ca2+-binding RTX toxin-like protein
MDDGITSLLTPFSDVVFGGLGKIHVTLGRLGNDTIYAYNEGFLKTNLPTSDLDIFIGDVLDIYITNPAYPDNEIVQNPLKILDLGPPNAGADRFILGDWVKPYYVNSNYTNSNNFFDLLTSNFLGFNDFALVLDFNKNQDVIQLHGSSQDYFILDINGIDAPQLGGKISGKAIFSLQQAIPDIVGFILANPDVTLNLTDSYFQYVGKIPPPEPLQQKMKQLGTVAKDNGYDTAVDSWGNLYVTGSTDGSLGGPNQGSYDAWVAKYDSSGNQLWVKQFGTANFDDTFGVTTDRDGNFYLVGGTQGDLFAPKTSQGADTWIAKYDANGNPFWTKQFGSAPDILVGSRDIKVDPQGNVFISGLTVKDNTRPDLFQFPVQDDAWVAKFDSNGNQQWWTELGGPAFDETYSVAVDKDGNSYTAGWTYGLTGPTVGLYDAWLTKFDPQGQIVWTQQFGTTGYEFPWAVETDSQGNIYLTGITTGLFPGSQGGNVEGNITGSSDIFVAKYLPNGTQSWVRQFGSNEDDGQLLAGMAIDSQDRIFLTGYTNRNLGSANAGSYDALVTSYDTNGNQLWQQQFGSPQLDYATGLTVDGANNLFVTGFTDGSLGGLNAGAVDTWIAKLDAQTGTVNNFYPWSLPGNNNPAFTLNDDVVTLTEGNDWGDALAGNDRVVSLAGNDTLYGNRGNDTILGGEGEDVINGNQGNDVLHGGQGNDQVSGNLANDTLWGDLGNDTLAGGKGSDLFMLMPNTGTDTILDFQSGQDLLLLSAGLNFGALAIAPVANGASISIANTGEVLAILTGIQASNIGVANFI